MDRTDQNNSMVTDINRGEENNSSRDSEKRLSFSEVAAFAREKLERIKLHKVSAESHAHQMDAIGLLRGIERGNIPEGNNRLHEDLVKLFGDLCSSASSEHSRIQIETLKEVIHDVAASGLSIGGFVPNQLRKASFSRTVMPK